MFIRQQFSIDIDLSVYNLDSFSRQSDDPFDIICIFLILIREYDNLIPLRFPETITDLVYDQIVSMLQCRFHRMSADFCPLSHIRNQNIYRSQQNRNIHEPS